VSISKLMNSLYKFSEYKTYFADLVDRNADNLEIRRNWSVCSGRVDKDLTQLICSWNVCIQHLQCTSYHNGQLLVRVEASRTSWNSLTENLTHTGLLYQTGVSSSALSDCELFLPTWLSPEAHSAPRISFLLCADSANANRMLLSLWGIFFLTRYLWVTGAKYTGSLVFVTV